ncbi:myosin-M heavy chain [Glossina fuscipes]|uniref:Myosin-M heavy chain n=1 Tax=Glossina fuscipes TaxID=7396 RepID=A0A8U0W2D3_9MUSC|nr:myosin-M heavy chain [Glossina fuscipes]KAI9586905.1 hypothetical protein GQX74_002752 [Glossina fuscipes]
MYTRKERSYSSPVNEMASPRTPETALSFSRELRQVLQERNLLTAKSRTKVCSMLAGGTGNTPISTPSSEVDKRRNFRLQAIQEIVSSEKTYLQQLELLMEYFVKPLKEEKVIDETSHIALFGQIEMIHNLNGEFLQELQSDMNNVAKAFLRMAPFFKLYSVYAFDYRNALFLLQHLVSKNAGFRRFLEVNESRPEVQRKLNSLMIVPIQRVPRYKLLLEQVLLYTSPADTDFKALRQSVKEIENTVSHINSCVEDQEVTQVLINLQNSLVNRTPNIVQPSRKVIKEGVLQKITRNGEEIKRYCVLMSDIFMYCKILKERLPNTAVDNALECCCIFPLKKCKVYELLPGNFKITCQGDGIIFSTSDMQVCRAWIGFIRDAIDLHIQCRKTLRKESSKRTPLRKKDVKHFGEEYMLSPRGKRCDFESIFRNKNRTTDSEEESDQSFTSKSCFTNKRKSVKRSFSMPSMNSENIDLRQDLKTELAKRIVMEKSISRSCKLSSNNKLGRARGILKKNRLEHNKIGTSVDHLEPNYAFADRDISSKSRFLANKVDSNLQNNITAWSADGRSHNLKSNNSDYVTYPFAIPKKFRNDINSPPKKKRVKFDNSLNAVYEQPQRFEFPRQLAQASERPSLRERIYDFFAKLF